MNRHDFLKYLAGGADLSILPRPLRVGAEPQTCTYKTAGGCRIQADVYNAHPNVRKRGLMYIHGGALISGTRKTLPRVVPDALQKLGYVLVEVDYRLAPETKLADIASDIEDAIHWMRTDGPRLYNLNSDRLAVAGDSAGGFLSLLAGFRVKPRPTVLAVFWGYGDVAAPWIAQPSPFYLKQPRVTPEEAYAGVGTTCLTTPPEHNGRGRYSLYCRQNGLWLKEVTGHDPATESKWFDGYCATRNVTHDYPPTFLLHGTADTDVPYEQSREMDRLLAQAGVEHEFRTVQGGNHGLSNAPPVEMQEIYGHVSKFLKTHLG